MKKLLAAMALFLLIIPCVARADTNIDNCTTLDTPGETYLLTANATSSGQCIRFSENNIIIDCQNNFISSNSTVIDFTGQDFLNNITIKNCNINCLTNENLYDGIYIEFYDSSIINNTFQNCYYGIMFDSNYANETDNLITNNTFINTTNTLNFQLEDSGFYYIDNYFYNNIFDKGVLLQYSGPDMLFNNWNTTLGNFWVGFSDNATACGTCNAGICSNPYIIDENNTDFLPLCTVAEQECTPSWVCGNWSQCVDGFQSRECTDENQCGDNRTKPAESQICEMPYQLPNATFNQTTCCPISTFKCADNETLVQLWNTSEGISWAVEDCPNGCDNVTNSCSPSTANQSIIIILIIIIIAVVLILLARWLL